MTSKSERTGFVQPGKEKLWGDLIAALQYLKGAYSKGEERLLQEHGGTGQGGMVSN